MQRLYSIVAVVVLTPLMAFADGLPDGRYLYVACPGIRDLPEFGGAGPRMTMVGQLSAIRGRFVTAHRSKHTFFIRFPA